MAQRFFNQLLLFWIVMIHFFDFTRRTSRMGHFLQNISTEIALPRYFSYLYYEEDHLLKAKVF